MSNIGDIGIDFITSVKLGHVSGWSYERKFGRNLSVSTTLAPVAPAATYWTPIAAASLEILSSSVNDTSAGSGGRKFIVTGLNSSWNEISQEITMNGTTAVAIPTQLIRVYRCYCSESGTYATMTAASHQGTITIRLSGGGATVLQVEAVGTMGLGQSLCGCYTVPSGYTAYVYRGSISIESGKTSSLYFFMRENSSDVSSPYTGTMRVTHTYESVSNIMIDATGFMGAFSQYTDIGFMAKTATGTSAVDVEFYILLKAN